MNKTRANVLAIDKVTLFEGNMINAILFDMDGTLYDETWPKARAEMLVSIYLSERNQVDSSIVYSAFRSAKSRIIAQYPGEIRQNDRVLWLDETLKYLNISDITGAELAEFYWNSIFACMIPYEDCVYVLPKLQDKYDLYVLTNEQFEICYKKLSALNMQHNFKEIFSAEAIGEMKPSIKIFEYVLSQISKSPDEVLLVGDNPSVDIVGGNKAGLKTAWLQRGKFHYFPQGDTEKPDIKFTNYIQLPKKIEKICG